MLLETDHISFIVTLLTGSIVLMVVFRSFYYKIRKKYPVNVNCWFCNTNTTVFVENRNSWVCPSCEQYNGFTSEGDYNKPIPAQYDECLNKPIVPRKRYIPKNNTNGLCWTCNRNQELKMYQLASFSPRNPKTFDQEVESFKNRLENEYELCGPCKATLEKTLGCQKKWTAALNLGYALKRGKYERNSERNRAWKEQLQTKIVAMIKFRYRMLKRWLLQLCLKMEGFLHWLLQHTVGITRSLLLILSIWIILVQQHGGTSSYIADVMSILPEGKEWAMEATAEWMWAVVGSAFFMQLVVVLVSTLRNTPYSIALDTICCLLWIGQQVILSACPTVDHQCELMLRNSTWSLTLDFRRLLEILCYATLFCETVAITTAGIPSTKPKCTCGQLRRNNQPRQCARISKNGGDLKKRNPVSTNKGNPFSTNKGNPFSTNKVNPFPTNKGMKDSFMASLGNNLETLKAIPFEDEDELGIGSLSLGPVEHNAKEQTTQMPCRKPVIHPARLNIKNIVQSSWVAGGYWQVPNTSWFPMAYHHYQVPFQNTFSYPHSRSSSQSSGFFTSGSASSSVCGDHPESMFMASDSPYRKHPYYANIFPGNVSSFSYHPSKPSFSSPCW